MDPQNEQAESQIGSARWKGTRRYQILARVGEGGMGVVHEAFDSERQQRVALKTLLHYDPTTLYQFKREFRTLADVQHKNLVHLHELVIDDAGQAFFTMELVRGGDFIQYVRGPTAPTNSNSSTRRGGRSESGGSPTPVDIDRLRAALHQLVAGVAALHAAGKLHRDIKPSNVLVTEEGRVVLLDFGVAADLSGRGESGSNESGEVVGTVRYMAPEQCDAGPPTTAADWYSVGVMLFEALVGRTPFGGSVVDILTMKSNVEPPPPSTFVEGIPVDLDRLCKALLRIDPEARPDAKGIRRWLDMSASSNPPPAPVAMDQATAFIGREAQLEALHDAFESVAMGRPVMVRVVGDSGMGKSTVVAHFLEELSSRDAALILRSRAYEREAVPFKAVDAAIDALSRRLIDLDAAGELPPLPKDIGLLTRIFPILRRVPAIRELPEVPAEEHGSRRRAFRALGELLTSVAGTQPLVLFIDDAHWGDTDSVALLVEVLRRPNASPMVLLLTDWGAAVEESPFLAEIRNRWPSNAEVREVTVGPLDTEDACHLALTLLDRFDEASQEIARTVARESRGSPFLIEELASGSRGSQSHAAAAPSSALTLDQMVGQRLERLPEHARRLVELLAVAGAPLSPSIIGQVLAIEGVVDEAIALAGARRFVRTGLRDGRDMVEITHNRIREKLIEQLSVSTLRDYHGRLARVFEEIPDAEAAVQHWVGAGDRDRAVRLAEGATEQAEAKFAFEQAARLIRFVLQHTPPSAPEAHAGRVRLANVLRLGGHHADSAREYVAAAASAPRDDRLELQCLASEQLLYSGRIDEGAKVLNAVLATAGLRAPRTSLEAFLWLVVYRVWLSIIGLRFKERAPESVSRDDRVRIEALHTVSLAFGVVNSILAACMQARHLIEALRKGDRFQLLRAVGLEVAHVASTGKPISRRERALSDLARDLAAKEGTLFGHAYVDICLAAGHHSRGLWREARTLLTPWTDNAPEGARAFSNARLILASAFFFMGEVEENSNRVDRLITEAEDRGDLYMLVSLRTGAAIRPALAADDPDRARRLMREALALWTQQGFVLQHWQAMVYGADIDLYSGDIEHAYETFVHQLPALKRSFILRGGFARAATWFAHGRLAIATLKIRPETRRVRMAEARTLAARLERETDPWVGGLAALLRAAIENAEGNRAGAIAELRSALERLQASETLAYLPLARSRLGQLLGGDEGMTLVQESTETLMSWGIRKPERWFDMGLPGDWGPATAADPSSAPD